VHLPKLHITKLLIIIAVWKREIKIIEKIKDTIEKEAIILH
jgi:hypothetical protein